MPAALGNLARPGMSALRLALTGGTPGGTPPAALKCSVCKLVIEQHHQIVKCIPCGAIVHTACAEACTSCGKTVCLPCLPMCGGHERCHACQSLLCTRCRFGHAALCVGGGLMPPPAKPGGLFDRLPQAPGPIQMGPGFKQPPAAAPPGGANLFGPLLCLCADR